MEQDGRGFFDGDEIMIDSRETDGGRDRIVERILDDALETSLEDEIGGRDDE
jgi:hypothetical protein